MVSNADCLSSVTLDICTYVQVCTQLRNLRVFVDLRKIAKIARSTIFCVHLQFFAVSLVNDIGPIILRETNNSRGAVFTV